MKLAFEVEGKIKKPPAEVFDAVYDPTKLSKYFTTGEASAPLDGGTTVTWAFHDYPGAFPVRVLRTVRNAEIEIEWANNEGGATRVFFAFEPLDDASTKVRISESGWKNETQESLDESYSHCQGWTQMLCCMKAWLEHGINLRAFFF